MNGDISIYLTIAFLVFSYFYLRTLFKVIDNVVIRKRRKSVFKTEVSKIEKEISLDARKREKMAENLAEYSARHPDKVASLLANWLVNGET